MAKMPTQDDFCVKISDLPTEIKPIVSGGGGYYNSSISEH